MGIQRRTIKLCGVQGCCPTVTFTKRTVTITDDQGGKVRLTKTQWKDLAAKVIRKRGS